MPHLNGDDLVLIALGESLGGAVDAHLVGCAQCAAEIESLRMTVELAELSNFGEDTPQPGDHVWQAIAAELGFGDSQRSSGSVATAVGDSTPPTTPTTTQAGNPPTDTRGVLNGSSERPLQSVPPLRSVPASDTPVGTPMTTAGSDASTSRRWSRWTAPLAAAVVGIAVGAGAVIVAQNRADTVTVEAIAPLTPVPGGPLAADQQEQLGKAQLVAAPTGQQVRVDAPALPPSANSYEVWLFGDDGRMVALGTLNDGTGTFAVPEGISTREYRVVDVSDEPPDGNPAHSGISLVRGAFS